MSGWTVLIVDDEAPAREELGYLVQQNEGIFKIEYAESGMEAVKKAKEFKPDLIFLDIELPDLTGLQVAELIAELDLACKIIFATAYDQYAIQAFKLRAFHYILKPYQETDVQAVFKQMHPQKKAPQHESIPHSAVKLAIEIEDGIKYLSPQDIMFISKEGKNVHVHTREAYFDAQYTLQELEQKLTPYGFFRCHKSYLINLQHVLEMHAWMHGAYNLRMADNKRSSVPASRNYVKDLRLKLEI